METKKLLNKKITQWVLLGAILLGCSVNAWAWSVPGSFNSWNTTAYFDGSSNYSVNLTAGQTYEFKIENNGTWYGKSGTIKRSSCSSWQFTGGDNCKIEADVTGTYVFHRDNDTPTITVTYPKLPDPEYYVTGNAPGTWGTWYKMTKGSNANEYYYDMPNTGEFKFSNTNNYNDSWYKNFNNTGTVTGVDLKNGPKDNGANCNLSNVKSGYTTPIRFWINVSTNYIWATATEVTCTDPTATQYPMTNATKTYGSVSAPTIDPASGAGTVKKTYYTGINGTSYNKSETLPTNAGTYKVTVDVNAGSTYCAKNSIDLTGNFVINKANQSALTFDGSTQCVGTNVTLSATGGSSGQTITYAKKSGEGTVSGTTLTTSTAGNVVVTATCPGGTNYNDVTADATFTFTAKPTAYAVSGTATICTGNSTNVTLANSQTGYTYKLYKGGSATSTTKTGTTGSALNFSVSEAGTYTVKGYVTGNESCSTDMTGSAVITVNQNMALTSISLSSASECIGGTSTISTSGLNLGGGSISYTSSNSSVASVSGTTITAKSAGTVTITGTVSGGCGSSVSRTASFKVKASNAISSISFTKSPLKVGETCTATAEYTTVGGSGAWSADGTYATIAADGTVTGQAIGTATITYTITGGCGGTVSKNATLEIITNCESPDAGSISGTTSICAGNSTTLTLSDQTAGTNLQWYKSTDGSSYSAVSDAKGTSLSTGTLNANAYYKVRVSRKDDASCYSETAVTTVTVTQIPSIETHTDGSRCGAGTVTLSATASAGDVKWYSASTGGTALKTGTSYTTPSISATTTYYVDATQNGCTTASRTTVTATVNTVPSIPSIAASTEDSGCGAGTVKFTASGVSAGSTIHWYENSTKKGEGNLYNYNDVAAGSSVTLKAKAVHTKGCESEFTATTTGTRKALPSLTTAPAGSAVTAYLWEPVNLTATTTDGTATVAISTSSTKYEVTDITNGKSLKAGNAGDTFTATYTATSSNGCQAQEVKTVTAAKATEDCSK